MIFIGVRGFFEAVLLHRIVPDGLVVKTGVSGV